MAKNDGMDALGALLGLGIAGALLGDDADADKHEQAFIKAMRGMKKEPETTKKKPIAIDGADAAKEIYNAYIQVGFTDGQAFELLKTVLSIGIRK